MSPLCEAVSIPSPIGLSLPYLHLIPNPLLSQAQPKPSLMLTQAHPNLSLTYPISLALQPAGQPKPTYPAQPAQPATKPASRALSFPALTAKPSPAQPANQPLQPSNQPAILAPRHVWVRLYIGPIPRPITSSRHMRFLCGLANRGRSEGHTAQRPLVASPGNVIIPVPSTSFPLTNQPQRGGHWFFRTFK